MSFRLNTKVEDWGPGVHCCAPRWGHAAVVCGTTKPVEENCAQCCQERGVETITPGYMCNLTSPSLNEAVAKKLDKKRAELERNRKRLDSLKTVRPAFMDEYEKLEGELQKQYSVYLERFRNLDYLQAELQTYHAADKAEVDEHDRNLKRMQKRLREEELRILRGEQEPVGSEASKKMMDDQPRPTQARPSQRSQRPRDLDSSEDIDSDEISRDSDSDSVSLAASSGAGSGIDELDDDDSGDSLSDDGASSRDFSGSASDDF